MAGTHHDLGHCASEISKMSFSTFFLEMEPCTAFAVLRDGCPPSTSTWEEKFRPQCSRCSLNQLVGARPPRRPLILGFEKCELAIAEIHESTRGFFQEHG